MHCHQSIWKDGKNAVRRRRLRGPESETSRSTTPRVASSSTPRRWLCAITNPTTNSYKRLVPGYEAPVNLAYSSRNRSAAIRVPMYSNSPKAKRIEARFPDSSGNPYLVFAALLMAGLDGVQNKLDAGDPLDKDIYSLSPEELKGVPTVPASLEGALDALEADHEFLLAGDVFTQDIVNEWLGFKRENEVEPMRLRTTPLEFMLYYDI